MNFDLSLLQDRNGDAFHRAAEAALADGGPARTRDTEADAAGPAQTGAQEERGEDQMDVEERGDASGTARRERQAAPSGTGARRTARAPRRPEVQILQRYHLPNHLKFTETTNEIVRKYIDEIRKEYLENNEALSDDETVSKVLLYIHQKVVRDFINMYTPYLGVLLFHRLGGGKTATSISVIQGFMTDAVVVIFVPSALITNYEDEIMAYGEKYLRLDQHWVAEDIDFVQGRRDGFVRFPKRMLDAFRAAATSRPGPRRIWRMREGAGFQPNYATLDDNAKAEVQRQIKIMLQSKYHIFPFDTFKTTAKNACLSWMNEQTRTANPFDNTLVVIDESHEFVSRVQTAMENWGADSEEQPVYDRDMPPGRELDRIKRSFIYLLYLLLCRAENCRTVLLSGTPIINHCSELALTTNLVKKFVTVITFESAAANFSARSARALKSRLDESPRTRCAYFDFAGNRLSVTRAPQPAATPDGDPVEVVNNEIFAREVRTALLSFFHLPNASDISVGRMEYEILPSDEKEFEAMFLLGGELNPAKANMLMRRIQGSVSYFDVPMTHSMPAVVLKPPEENHFYGLPNRFRDIQEVLVPMSDKQFKLYCEAREWELEQQVRDKQKKKSPSAIEEEEDGAGYRPVSRARCNYVFLTKQQVDHFANKDPENKKESPLEMKKRALMEMIRDEKPNAGVSERDSVDLLVKKAGKLKTHFSLDVLKDTSPKMRTVLRRIRSADNVGNHLVYSYWRTFEGINFFALALRAALDYRPFTLTKVGDSYKISDDSMGNLRKKKLMYLDYGEASTDKKEKSVLRRLFNSDWHAPEFSDELRSQLQEIMRLNDRPEMDLSAINLHEERNSLGVLIKVFLITDSGTRGLTLKCVRHVHMLDPFWHMIKLMQIKGRGERMHGHDRLAEPLRTLSVYLYLATFTREQARSLSGVYRAPADAVTVDGVQKKITSDEFLFYHALRKHAVNEAFVECMRRTAIDCALFNRYGFKNPANGEYTCFSVDAAAGLEYASVPDIKLDNLVAAAPAQRRREEDDGAAHTARAPHRPAASEPQAAEPAARSAKRRRSETASASAQSAPADAAASKTAKRKRSEESGAAQTARTSKKKAEAAATSSSST